MESPLFSILETETNTPISSALLLDALAPPTEKRGAHARIWSDMRAAAKVPAKAQHLTRLQALCLWYFGSNENPNLVLTQVRYDLDKALAYAQTVCARSPEAVVKNLAKFAHNRVRSDRFTAAEKSAQIEHICKYLSDQTSRPIVKSDLYRVFNLAGIAYSVNASFTVRQLNDVAQCILAGGSAPRPRRRRATKLATKAVIEDPPAMLHYSLTGLVKELKSAYSNLDFSKDSSAYKRVEYLFLHSNSLSDIEEALQGLS